jgi:phosphatidylglycerophosphate synthase
MGKSVCIMSAEISSQLDQQTASQSEVLAAAKSYVGIKERVTKARKQYDLFMYNHGRTVADLATNARRVVGVAEAACILLDWRGAANVGAGISAVTDIFDGHAARKHEHGGTAEGAQRDQQYDKQRSFMVEAALVTKGRLDWRHVGLRLASDVAMNNIVRPYFAKKGIDTKAGWAGKASTSTVFVSEITALNDRNPQSIQNLATGLKLGRVGIYAADWGLKLWKKNREATKAEQSVV